MAIFYIDDRATGANNGTSPTDAWQSLADYVAQAAGSVIEVVAGSGPYREILDLKGNGATGNYITWNLNRCHITAADDMNDAAFKWTLSAGGTNEYYLELAGGGNPLLVRARAITIDGFLWIVSAETSHTIGAPGSLTNKQPGWGDGDALGYSTVYLRSDAGEPNSVGLDVEASQRDNVISSNLQYHKFNNGILEHGNVRVVRCQQTVVAEPWLFDKCIFAYADTSGLESKNGSAILTSCLFYWCGHQSISMAVNTVPVSVKTYNCTEWGAHLYSRYAATCTAALTLDIQNCVTGNNEAGSISKDSVAAVLVENNNMLYPRMTAGGGSLGYIFPANWTPTDAADIPPATATTLSDQGLLLSPQFVKAVDDGFEKCDFRLQASSPAVGAGIDVGVTEYFDGTAIDAPPNIGAYHTAPVGGIGVEHTMTLAVGMRL